MKLLAIDPGVTTGYCFATTVTEVGAKGITGIQLRPEQHVDDVDDIWNRLIDFRPRYIVCEDFEFRNKSRAGLVLFSVQAIGIVRLYELEGAPNLKENNAVVLQKAAQGKGYYTDASLKKLNVYMRAMPHAMDATRHLLHWLTFSSGYSLIEGQDIADLVKLVK